MILDDLNDAYYFIEFYETTRVHFLSKLHPVVSCGSIAPTLKAIFRDRMLKDFAVGADKVAYITTDTLSPRFSRMILDDLNGAYYFIEFYETTNEASKKEF